MESTELFQIQQLLAFPGKELGSVVYTTGAQEWHIVPLLGDVTCPTTAVHYVSVTSDLRVLRTEKHWPMRRQHTMYVHKQEFTVQGGST